LAGFDLASPEKSPWPAGIRTAVLCAWQGGVVEAAEEPGETRAVNVHGNLALIDRLRQTGVNIVFLSTSLVFSQAPAEAYAPLSPCCEYARQKAEVEQSLDPAVDAIVRLTKVGETVLPRLQTWAGSLREGQPVRASTRLRLAPIRREAAVTGLGWLAENFQPGVFQMSAQHDASYFDVARLLAKRLAVAPHLVEADQEAGSKLFDPAPAAGSLVIAAPPGCPDWPEGDDALQFLVESAIS
jgi:dTDP-4-dehydrorhamnose reductase